MKKKKIFWRYFYVVYLLTLFFYLCLIYTWLILYRNTIFNSWLFTKNTCIDYRCKQDKQVHTIILIQISNVVALWGLSCGKLKRGHNLCIWICYSSYKWKELSVTDIDTMTDLVTDQNIETTALFENNFVSCNVCMNVATAIKILNFDRLWFIIDKGYFIYGYYIMRLLLIDIDLGWIDQN